MNINAARNASVAEWMTACSAMMRACDARMQHLGVRLEAGVAEDDEKSSWMEDEEIRALAGFTYDASGKAKAFFGGAVQPVSVPLAQRMLKDFKDADEIEIDINSPGGSALSGVAIRNLFAAAKQKIVMNVVGQASSAASLMLQGADVRNVDVGGTVGIHRAWIPTEGNAEKLLADAAFLRGLDKSLVEIYAERVEPKNMPLLEKMLDRETVLSGGDAVALGLADSTRARSARGETDKGARAARTEEAIARLGARFVRNEIKEAPAPAGEERASPPVQGGDQGETVEFTPEDPELAEGVEFKHASEQAAPADPTRTERGDAINSMPERTPAPRRIAFF